MKLKFIPIIIVLIVENLQIAVGQQCTVLPPCRMFQINAAKRYQPDINFDGIISLTGQVTGSASLNNQPLQFQLPQFLNVTNGNSAALLATITIQTAPPITSTIICAYKGIGVGFPLTPEEVAAANAYQFLNCRDANSNSLLSLTAGSSVTAAQINVNVQNGGNNNPGDVTSISVTISESPATLPPTQPLKCVAMEPQTWAVAGGYTLNQIFAATFATSLTTLSCLPPAASSSSSLSASKSSYSITSTSIAPLTSPIPVTPSVSSSAGNVATSISGSASAQPQATSSQIVFSLPPTLPSTFTSSATPVSDQSSTDSSSKTVLYAGMPLQTIIYIGIGAGGFLILLLVVVTTILCCRRSSSYAQYDLEKNGKMRPIAKSNGTFFSSRDSVAESTKFASLDNLDFDSVYGGQQYDEQLDFHRSTPHLSVDNLNPYAPSVNTTAAFRAQQANDVEQTLMNTRAVIALPGFLKLDYHADLRPDALLAEGGGGIIYQAELLDDRLKEKHRVKRVAVKIVKNPANWDHEELLTTFRQEVSIMWSLNFHDHIIKLIGYTEEPMAIVMKFYSLNVGELVKNAQFHYLLTTDTVLRFTYHVVDAMTQMHSLGIVHRDLKTINLLIDAPAGSANDPVMWKVVVCDFGLAKPLSDVEVIASKTADVQGISVRYAAPEMFQRIYLKGANKPHVCGEEEKKGDVYSLSIIQWDLLEKKFSWPGMKNDEIEWNVRNGHRPEISEETKGKCFNEPVIELLVTIMQMAWSQDWKERPNFLDIRKKLDPMYVQLLQYTEYSRSSSQDIQQVGGFHNRQTTGGTRSSMHNSTKPKSRPISVATSINTQPGSHQRASTFNGNGTLGRSAKESGNRRMRFFTSNNSQLQNNNNINE